MIKVPTDDLETVATALASFVGSWPTRAAVKKDGLIFPEFEVSKPDFLEHLLPFHEHPLYEAAPWEIKQKVLSCGWIVYNEKTVAIESKVVNPACMHIIDGDIPALRSQLSREAASQALVDESFHILLVVSACGYTKKNRGLTDLRVPQFELINRMQTCQEQNPERWKRILIQLACSIVSEVMVSDYLRLLSKAEGVQPLNVLATEIHRRDESVHNALFKDIGAEIYQTLSPQEQDFFLRVLPRPIDWFANAELEVWRSVLKQIGFPQADKMIDDCLHDQKSREVNLDLTTLTELYEDLGIERDFIT